MIKHFFIGIFLIQLIPLYSLGQECYEYHKQACYPSNSKYIYDYNSNSVSFLFKPGEMRDVPMELYSGKDYRITICSSEIFDQVVAFSILKDDGTVLYDNGKFNYELNIEFTSLQTQEVIMQIEVPESESPEIEGCVGILIEDMVSVKTGF